MNTLLMPMTETAPPVHRGGNHAFRAFDDRGNCILPLRTVKEILKCDIRYSNDEIHIRRKGVTHEFDRIQYPTAWDCIRAKKWFNDAFQKAAKTYLNDHPKTSQL